MSKISKTLIGFHEFKPAPSGTVPQYRWESVFKIFLESGESAIYRRFATQRELKKEYDVARMAEKKFDGVRVHRRADALVVVRTDAEKAEE